MRKVRGNVDISVNFFNFFSRFLNVDVGIILFGESEGRIYIFYIGVNVNCKLLVRGILSLKGNG